jgi:L-amino acid N-acyltransferase YncA
MALNHTLSIRTAVLQDSASITAIWLEGQRRLEIELPPHDHEQYFQQRILARDGCFKIWVAETAPNQIIGWFALNPLLNNPSLRKKYAEASLYVHPDHTGSGAGFSLVSHSLSDRDTTELDYIIAFVHKKNVPAQRLATKAGFQIVGRLPYLSSVTPHKELLILALETLSHGRA